MPSLNDISEKDKLIVKKAHGESLTQGSNVQEKRTIWLLEWTLEPIREAINAYYDEFCNDS